jgi:hypothetical protein
MKSAQIHTVWHDVKVGGGFHQSGANVTILQGFRGLIMMGLDNPKASTTQIALC